MRVIVPRRTMPRNPSRVCRAVQTALNRRRRELQLCGDFSNRQLFKIAQQDDLQVLRGQRLQDQGLCGVQSHGASGFLVQPSAHHRTHGAKTNQAGQHKTQRAAGQHPTDPPPIHPVATTVDNGIAIKVIAIQ